MFSIFRSFDKDGDGYVSYGDFEDQLNSLKINTSKAETASIMKLLDKDSKGYFDFRSFSQVITPNMSS
jgi:Ca2+-binding EF-hand superfamily protein